MVLAVVVAGCRPLGPVLDGTSVSFGPARSGVLYNPVSLPTRGAGYLVPPTWSERGLGFGVDELVSMVVHAGRELSRKHPGSVVSVGDLSRADGGRSAWHRSHQTGRDVDLLFVVEDLNGEPAVARAMRRFGADGVPLDGAPVRFDDAGNWSLIAALLESPVAEVQYVFISDDLKQRLLDHAIASDAPRALIQRASYVLHQPGDSLPHDDHMHVRIFCSQTDLAAGCEDFGVLRWHKKDYKYERRADSEARAYADLVAAAAGDRLPIGAVAVLSL